MSKPLMLGISFQGRGLFRSIRLYFPSSRIECTDIKSSPSVWSLCMSSFIRGTTLYIFTIHIMSLLFLLLATILPAILLDFYSNPFPRFKLVLTFKKVVLLVPRLSGPAAQQPLRFYRLVRCRLLITRFLLDVIGVQPFTRLTYRCRPHLAVCLTAPF